MAAEAFLVDEVSEQVKADLAQALVDGNHHNSLFTATQAANFLVHWEVVAQRPSTSTGFSGTLFRNKDTNEFVMSFRSTEFIDDAARDNTATNALELKETGYAWGQLRDMEVWYGQLSSAGGPLGGGQAFSVTGYSLGGHLATAFNAMHANAATQTFTFNGAGIGAVDTRTTLKTLVDRFTWLAANADGNAFTFANSSLSSSTERASPAHSRTALTGERRAC